MRAATSTWRLLLPAAFVAWGLTAVWFFVMAIVYSSAAQSLVTAGRYEQLYVRVDGEPVVVRLAATGFTQQVQTLDRQPTSGDAYQILYPAYVSGTARQQLNSSREWSLRLASISDGGAPAVFWYLIHDGQPNGRAYGVGYHSETKRVVGYFGREGFSETLPARDVWFQVAGDTGLATATPERGLSEPYWFTQPSMYLLANGQLWDINTQKKTVASIERCDDAFSIGWAWQLSDTPAVGNVRGQNAGSSTPQVLLVRTPETCLLFDPKTGKGKEYPVPTSLQSASLAGFQLADGRLLTISQDYRLASELKVAWIDAEGKIAKEKLVAIDSPAGNVSEPVIGAVAAITAPGPIWQVTFLWVLGSYALGAGEAESIPAAIGFAMRSAWPTVLLVFAISAVLSWIAYRRQKQIGLPGASTWATFVFLFGVAGWFAYRWHRTWPVIEDCPNCRQPAPRDREDCTECGTEYPPPALKGTEVFA